MTHLAIDLVVRKRPLDRPHLLDDALPFIDPEPVCKPIDTVRQGLDQRQSARLTHMRDARLPDLHGKLATAVELQHHPVTLQRIPVPQSTEAEALHRRAGALLPVGTLLHRLAHLLRRGAGGQNYTQCKHDQRGGNAKNRTLETRVHHEFSGNGLGPDCIEREAKKTANGVDCTRIRQRLHHALTATALGLLSLCVWADELEMIDIPAEPGALAPRLVVDPANDSVLLSWLEPDDAGHVLRFSSFRDGTFAAARTIARGSDWFVNWADTPGLHPAADGSWTAHWLTKSADATYAYDIKLARSTDQGASWVPLASPHRDQTPTEHGFLSHFLEPDGSLGLVWLDGRNTASGHDTHAPAGAMTLRTASVRRDGSLSESSEIDDRVCDCCQTASANTVRGPIVVYRDRSPDNIRDIAILRRLDGRWTEPQRVHADGWMIGGCPVNGPAVAATEHTVAVAWFTMAANTPVVRIAFSHDAGAQFAAPRQFSAGQAIGRVDLVRHGSGWAMSWMEQADGRGALQLALFDDAGILLEQTELTRMDGGRISGLPRIASTGDQLLIVWTGTRSEANARTPTELKAAIYRPRKSVHGSIRG